MNLSRSFRSAILSLLLLGALPARVLGSDVLETGGFSSCAANTDITLNNINVQFDRSSKTVTFDVSGTSAKSQNVTASLVATAYGRQVYSKSFDPCDSGSYVERLCPVPQGEFSAQGSTAIPAQYASMIPAIAYQVPDLDGEATLQLKSVDSGEDLACIQSTITNGKTASVKGVKYAAVGVAGAALVLGGATSLAGLGTGAGATGPSPGFGDVVMWFQGVAMNGMLSVNYPTVYRSFTQNFAFAGGLISWNHMQSTIDSFRNRTGGNLTDDSVEYLKKATLTYSSDTNSSSSSNHTKRAIDFLFEGVNLVVRDVSTDVNGTQSTTSTSGLGDGSSAGNSSSNNSSASNGTASSTHGGEAQKVMHVVHGIQGYVEQLTIPQANTFMTVLLIFAIVIAAITVGILLLKVALETWALFGTFPKRLTSFRKRYWLLLAKTITNLILLLYGVWTLYCVYQFTHGDSWAAKTLAGVTFGAFTAVLLFFTVRIWLIVRKHKKMEGDASALFEDKDTWQKYSLFYDNYKKGVWWLFIPAIIYMFAKGCVLAAGDGHGLSQTVAQLIVESLMLTLLLWQRPYVTKAGNWINIVIQVTRVLSVICILVFVEELGISQTTKTVTGVVLIAVQSALSGVLAILIAVNAIIVCIRENPHRKARKENEKRQRDLDDLTPLDARNSLLMDPGDYKGLDSKQPLVSVDNVGIAKGGYDAVPPYRDYTPAGRRFGPRESSENLVDSAAVMGHGHERSISRGSGSRSPSPEHMAPTVPDVGAYRGVAY
ncbi:MAG: hypothetical protein M1819_000992 [Sarea resinae]|nr:MAG: hypothetical protein M1819_000992 [Sarea resinae]